MRFCLWGLGAVILAVGCSTSSSDGGSAAAAGQGGSAASSGQGGQGGSAASSGQGGSAAGSGQGGSATGGSAGTGGTTGLTSAAIWMAYCNDEAVRTASCPNEGFTLMDCQSYAPCTNLYTPASTTAITACLLERPCGESDDRCASEALTSGSPSPAVAAFKSKCTTYVDACDAAQTPIWEDLATICLINQLAEEFPPAFDRCFDMPCTEFRGCFDDVAANQFGCAK